MMDESSCSSSKVGSIGTEADVRRKRNLRNIGRRGRTRGKRSCNENERNSFRMDEYDAHYVDTSEGRNSRELPDGTRRFLYRVYAGALESLRALYPEGYCIGKELRPLVPVFEEPISKARATAALTELAMDAAVNLGIGV